MWSRAKILSIVGNKMKIHFINDIDNYDRILKLNNNNYEIAPYESKTKDDWDWRSNLKEGDEFDCIDSSMIWYSSTVLNTIIEKSQDYEDE